MKHAGGDRCQLEAVTYRVPSHDRFEGGLEKPSTQLKLRRVAVSCCLVKNNAHKHKT